MAHYIAHEIRCCDPQHLRREGQPGWADILGYCELPDDVPLFVGGPGMPSVSDRISGYLCECCNRALNAALAAAAAAGLGEAGRG